MPFANERERAIAIYKRRRRELTKLQAEAERTRDRHNDLVSRIIPPVKNALESQLRNLGQVLDREIHEEDKACSS